MFGQLFFLQPLRRLQALCLTIALTIWLPHAVVQADDASAAQRYFDSLRQRGLHALAEEYATTLLRNGEMPFPQRMELTVQLSRTLIDHSQLVDGSQQAELLAEAERQLNGLRARPSGAADAVRLQLESARIPAERGAAAIWQSRLRPDDTATRGEALQLVGRATTELTQAETSVEALSSSPRERGAPPLDVDRLTQSALQCRILKCELLLDAALISVEPALRQRYLAAAAGELNRSAKVRPTGEVATEFQRLAARTAREQGDLTRAVTLLNAISSATLTASQRDAVLAERLRLELQLSNSDAALRLVEERQQNREEPAEEFRFTFVEVLLQAWREAGRKQQASLADQILQQAREQTGKTYGRWGQLARLRMSRAEDEATLGPELAEIVRRAQGNYGRGDIAGAAADYSAAIAQAAKMGLTDKAVEFGLTRGSILISDLQWAAARDAFSQLVAYAPQHPQAAEANLLACYAVGKLAEQQPDRAGDEFASALRDHMTRFPQSASRWEAAWMLAGWMERQDQWTEAITTYRQIPTEHSRYAAAQSRFIEIYALVLAQLAENGGDAAPWRKAASEDALQVGDALVRIGSAWSMEQCQTALSCAGLLLRLNRQQTALASRLIARVQDRLQLEARRAQSDGIALPANWQQLDQRATRLQLLQLLNEDRIAEAQRLLARLEEMPDALLAFLGSLQEVSTELDPSQRYSFGTLMQSAIRRLERRRSTLSPTQQQQLDRCGIQAALLVEDFSLASSLLQGLVQNSPEETPLWKQLIEVSLKRGQPEDMRRARDAWMRLEQLERPGTPAWLEARVSIAELQVKLSEREAAKKLLGVTRTLYPQMGKPELKARADALWAQLQ